MLDSVNYNDLTESNRHLFDLLSIKANDKAYIQHRSDSLILDVIKYYESHPESKYYPEALYYGGRVYSDIGDLPTSLEYFQKSLDNIPPNVNNQKFRSNVLNQTGRLLHTLRMDSISLKYLEKSINIETQYENNDYRIATSHKLLSNVYQNMANNNEALYHIKKAVRLSPKLSESTRQSILIDYAHILAIEGYTDSALKVIRPLPPLVNTISLPYCLAVASEIYRDAQIPDTAYMYARQLTLLNEPKNQRTGYKVIFSDELNKFVAKDTLLALMPSYKKTIEDYLDRNEAENAIIQNTKFNYNIQVRQRKESDHKLKISIILSIIIFILFLISLLIILYEKLKITKNGMQYLAAINILKSSNTSSVEKHLTQNKIAGLPGSHGDFSDLKKKILSGIYEVTEKDKITIINPNILYSSVYKNLRQKLTMGKSISSYEENEIYDNLKKLIESVSPGFIYRLYVLSDGNITNSERRIAMLIKCGFAPKEIADLLGRQKNTISTQRSHLSSKILGMKRAGKELDLVIISL